MPQAKLQLMMSNPLVMASLAASQTWAVRPASFGPSTRKLVIPASGATFQMIPGDRGPMSIGVFAFAFGKLAESCVIHDKVVVQLPATKIGMSNLDTRIQNGDAHAGSVALSDGGSGFFRCNPVARNPFSIEPGKMSPKDMSRSV